MVHQRMCKLSSFLSRLPATISPRTTHILLTLSLVLKHPISFHSDVFNKWKSRSQTIKESRDFVAYYKLLNMVKHFDDLCLLKLFSIVLILLQICKDVGYITNTTSKEEETLGNVGDAGSEACFSKMVATANHDLVSQIFNNFPLFSVDLYRHM